MFAPVGKRLILEADLLVEGGLKFSTKDKFCAARVFQLHKLVYMRSFLLDDAEGLVC